MKITPYYFQKTSYVGVQWTLDETTSLSLSLSCAWYTQLCNSYRIVIYRVLNVFLITILTVFQCITLMDFFSDYYRLKIFVPITILAFAVFGPSELDQWHIRKHESSPQWHRQTFNIQYTEWVKEVNKFLGFALHSNCRGVIRISFAPCSVQVYSPLSHGLHHHILDMLRVDAGVWNYC
jgi:hypothetical protein